MQAFEFEIHEDRKPLNHLVETFFPIFEGILGSELLNSSPNVTSIMILIAKVFYMVNQVSLQLPISQRLIIDRSQSILYQ